MFTIFTPTYNRANTLLNLYKSLLEQTNQNFEWIVVDDGSTDDTELLMNKWIKENKIKILYFRQENGGKHRAINKGLEKANKKLFFIVDSDDYLPKNSLQAIENVFWEIKDEPNFIGLCGLKGSSETETIGGTSFPSYIVDSDFINIYQEYGMRVDMAEVFKTEIFKKYKFPEIEGERFVAESIIWNRMAIDYKVRYFNEIIYICEYLPEGLSYNSIKNRKNNPRYATLLYSELANNPKANTKLKIKSMINYWRFFFCRKESIQIGIKELGGNIRHILTLPIGYLMYLKDSHYDMVKLPKI
ncbi:glycosyltransferase family A protein [Riemerella anatipestifer]|nr:glycosyltransferase family A protein [Riemerella anatipestifer]